MPHWEIFKKLRNEVNIQMRNAKSIFFSVIKLTTALGRMTLRKLGRSSTHYWGRITNRTI